MSSTKKRIFLTFVNKITIAVLVMLGSAITAWYLDDVNHRGVYNNATVYVSVYSAFFGSFGSYISYAITRLKKDLNRVNANAMVFFLSVALLTFLSLPIGYGLHLFPKGFGFSFIPYLIITAPFVMGFSFYSRMLQGLNEIERLNRANIVQNITFVIFGLFVWIFLKNYKDDFKLNLILLAWTVSNIISFAYAVYLARKASNVTLKPKWEPETGKQFLNFGFNVSLGSLVERLNARADYLMVDFLHRSTGIYGIAVAASEVMNFVAGSVTIVIFSKVSGAEKKESSMVTAKVFRITAVASLLAGICGVLLSGLIPIIFSSKYRPAVAPFIILVFGVALYGLNSILIMYFTNQLSRPRLAMYLDMLAIVINVGVDFFLIPKLDITGAAIGSFVAYTAQCFVAALLFKKFSHIRLRDLLWMKQEDWQVILQVFKKSSAASR